MRRVALLLLTAVAAMCADPYAAWAQGRPAEAVAPLIAAAKDSGRWDAWLDAGLAAAAAGDRGRAVACLAQARNAAPERPEPAAALRALGAALPMSWSERAGPLAIPGTGWSGVVLLGLAGLACGGAFAVRRGRSAALIAATALAMVAAPGVVAMWIDGRTEWRATVRDTSILDSTGAPQRALPAGSLLQREPQEIWGGRVLVRTGDGTQAYVALADLDPAAAR